MADPLDFLTLDEAKDALNVPLADDSLDDELAMYVTAISLRLEDDYGPVVKRAVTETHDGGSSAIYLESPPVAAIDSVVEYRSGVEIELAAETPTVRSADDWYLGTAGVLWRRAYGGSAYFPGGRGNIVVTYTAGRFDSTAEVSPKFKQAAAKMLTWLWRGDQGAGSSTFGGGDEGASLFGLGFALPNVVKELLAREQRPPVIA